ncbi:MAG: hypothetical protein AB7G87_07680 [Clostridia bacterium]
MNQRPFSIKPMSIGNILDYTFRIYRNNFTAILAFSALIGGLFGIITLILNNLAAPPGMVTDPWSSVIQGLKSGNFENLFENFAAQAPEPNFGPDYLVRSILMMVVTYGAGLINYVFIYPFVQGGISNITQKYYHGFKLDAATSLKQTWKNFGKLIVTGLSLIVYSIGFGIVFLVIMLIFMAIMIPLSFSGAFNDGLPVILIILFILFFTVIIAVSVVFFSFITFVYPIAVTEGVYHFNAIGRSFKLVAKKFWKVVGVNFLVYLLVYVVIGAITGLGVTVAVLSPVNIMFQQVVTLVISALATPIIYIAATILYMDVRIRVEGYDLELMSDNLEGNETWERPQK